MPSNLNLDYYYGSEAEQYSFYRIPKALMTDPRYKSVSVEAKVLYGLLLDRMGLSVKNNWMDSDRRVCQRQSEIVRKRRRNFVDFRRVGGNKIKRLLAGKES